jgi:hypothetical protein
MNRIEVNKVFIIDPISLAVTLESIMSPYLKDASDKVFKNDTKQDTVANRIKKEYIEGEIYENTNTNSASLIDNNIPIRGIELIKAYINMLLVNNSAWLNSKQLIEDSVGMFIKDEFIHTQAIFDLIDSNLFDLRTDILGFIGKNKWLMHFQNMRNSDIIIDQCQDYRAWDWTNRMENKEWT